DVGGQHRLRQIERHDDVDAAVAPQLLPLRLRAGPGQRQEADAQHEEERLQAAPPRRHRRRHPRQLRRGRILEEPPSPRRLERIDDREHDHQGAGDVEERGVLPGEAAHGNLRKRVSPRRTSTSTSASAGATNQLMSSVGMRRTSLRLDFSSVARTSSNPRSSAPSSPAWKYLPPVSLANVLSSAGLVPYCRRPNGSSSGDAASSPTTTLYTPMPSPP